MTRPYMGDSAGFTDFGVTHSFPLHFIMRSCLKCMLPQMRECSKVEAVDVIAAILKHHWSHTMGNFNFLSQQRKNWLF